MWQEVKAKVSDLPGPSTEVRLVSLFKRQLKCKLNICFDCGLMFWYFKVVLAVLYSVCSNSCFSDELNGFPLLLLWSWHDDTASVSRVAAVLLHLVGLFSCGFCKLLHSLWSYFLTTGVASSWHKCLIQIHTYFCCRFRECDKQQKGTVDKVTAKAKRTVKAKLLWAETKIPSKYFFSPPTLGIPFHWFFLNVCCIWIQSKG